MMDIATMPNRSKEHPNLWVFEHPVIQDKLTQIRNCETQHAVFRSLLNEIAGLMFFHHEIILQGLIFQI